MHFAVIDWVIVITFVLFFFGLGISVRKFVKNIDQYLVAGREMNVWLGVASLAASELGLVTVMYTAENGYRNGFAGAIPGFLMCCAAFGLGITGFIIKPLRKSNILTLPQLFQTRYSKGVRWMAGIFIAIGGILNMGIFLRLGGQFIVYCTGIPGKYLEITMTVFLAIILIYTMVGGMLSVLVTNYVQFIVLALGMVITSIVVIQNEGFGNLVDVVVQYKGDGGFNPLLSPEMGVTWFIWQSILAVAAISTWQTILSRVLSAKNEKTACQVFTRSSFYFVGRFLLPALWACGAMIMFGTKYLEPGMDPLNAMPTYLGQILGPGLLGFVIAAMVAAEMSTDSSYLLAWGGVIYNDILSPVLKKKPSQKAEVWIIRFIVLAVGLFLLVYGLWYEIPGSAWDYLAITGSIYLSSMFALVIGALYWEKSNSWGGYAALFLGAAGPLTFLVMNKVAPESAPSAATAGLSAFVLAGAGLVVGSFLKPKNKN